mmetsp:Transcript_3024/g.6907  ORF Transcript_3024/g.6907 Transcript_3024/m.6907 type:complete len:200 (+) Transcript_3024:150-749(+)
MSQTPSRQCWTVWSASCFASRLQAAVTLFTLQPRSSAILGAITAASSARRVRCLGHPHVQRTSHLRVKTFQKSSSQRKQVTRVRVHGQWDSRRQTFSAGPPTCTGSLPSADQFRPPRLKTHRLQGIVRICKRCTSPPKRRVQQAVPGTCYVLHGKCGKVRLRWKNASKVLGKTASDPHLKQALLTLEDFSMASTAYLPT